MDGDSQYLLDVLKNRYTTKMFDASARVPDDKIEALIESLVLTPSSINSQPWHVYVVSSPEEKQRLSKAAWDDNKPKFVDCDYLFVFCAKTDFTAEDFLEIETLVARVRQRELAHERVKMMSNYLEHMDPVEKKYWLQQQIFIMLGQFLTSCAIMEVDACPIGGFSNEVMDELLELKARGLTSVVTAAVGYRHPEDFNQLELAAKVRFSRDKVITQLK